LRICMQQELTRANNIYIPTTISTGRYQQDCHSH